MKKVESVTRSQKLAQPKPRKWTVKTAFEAVWRAYLINGQKPGWDAANGHCVYRSGDGGKCAIGTLLPEPLLDKIIRARMNNEGSIKLLGSGKIGPEVQALFTRPTLRVLPDLQGCHDSSASKSESYFLDGIRDSLMRFSGSHGLKALAARLDKLAPATLE